jgi:hypothetical protein
MDENELSKEYGRACVVGCILLVIVIAVAVIIAEIIEG